MSVRLPRGGGYEYHERHKEGLPSCADRRMASGLFELETLLERPERLETGMWAGTPKRALLVHGWYAHSLQRDGQSKPEWLFPKPHRINATAL